MSNSQQLNPNHIINYHQDILSEENHRYKSWEHCFNAFQDEKSTDKLALHLAFYLASWGMYRGSSGLLQKDYKVHVRAVEIIQSSKYKHLHCVNNDVTAKDIDKILFLKKDLAEYYESITYLKNGESELTKVTPTDTLITKIMLGTLGCIPAYDRYYIDGLKVVGLKGYTVNRQSLQNLFQFAEQETNRTALQQVQKEIANDGMHYPIMKLLDMYFWMLGFEEEEKEKYEL